MSDEAKMLISFLSSVGVAVLASYVTVQLSLKNFYSQKWWESKAAAYSRIIESLYDLKRYLEHRISIYGTEHEDEDDQTGELEAKSSKGWDEIARVTGIGAYIVSDEAINQLKKLHEDRGAAFRNTNTIYEYWVISLAALDTCIGHLRECAKKDLKVK